MILSSRQLLITNIFVSPPPDIVERVDQLRFAVGIVSIDHELTHFFVVRHAQLMQSLFTILTVILLSPLSLFHSFDNSMTRDIVLLFRQEKLSTLLPK